MSKFTEKNFGPGIQSNVVESSKMQSTKQKLLTCKLASYDSWWTKRSITADIWAYFCI